MLLKKKALGSTLAKGLVDAAAMSNGNNQSSVEIFNILAQTKDSMDKSNLIQKRIEENLDKANSIQERATEVQSQMLQFLQSINFKIRCFRLWIGHQQISLSSHH